MRRKLTKLGRSVGTIEVSRILLRVYPEAMKRLYRVFFPLEMHTGIATDSVTITGCSHLFREVGEGYPIPHYDVIVAKDKKIQMQETHTDYRKIFSFNSIR